MIRKGAPFSGAIRHAFFRVEKEDPAMHKTNTVDYSVVYDGEIWLELDDGKVIHLKGGDVVVQNGTTPGGIEVQSPSRRSFF